MGLGERRCRILTAVVHDYVETAEPVGSETLAQRYDFGVKPATIRNELAAMSEMGYLRQPHTSAGRVPSDMGYRFYVDELMPTPLLGTVETDRAKLSYDNYQSEIESILQQTCRILSDLTKYTSLATPPQMEVVSIKQVAILAVAVNKILIITVLDSGHIDHRMLDYHGDLMPSDLMAITNLLNERFSGVSLNQFAAKAIEELPAELAKMRWLYKKVAAGMKQALSNATDNEVYMDGTSHMLKQPEFAHGEKIAAILETLEHRRNVYQSLSSTLLGEEVIVIIGGENRFAEMHECSLVASGYSIGGRILGSIGVVGPTRMDYPRAVAAVKFMASNLSDLLTLLSIG